MSWSPENVRCFDAQDGRPSTGSIQCVFKNKTVDFHSKFLIHIYVDLIFSFAFFLGSLLLLYFLLFFLMHGGCVASRYLCGRKVCATVKYGTMPLQSAFP